MNEINGKKAFAISREETLSLMTEKTGLSPQMVRLVIEAFTFVIRKTLLENGKIIIYKLGTFFLKIHRRKDRIRRYAILFKTCDDFKDMMAGTEKPRYVKKQQHSLKPLFRQIAQMLGIKLCDIRHLFSLYTYCIIANLLKYNEYKIDTVGFFMIVDDNTKYRNTGISMRHEHIRSKYLTFRTYRTLTIESNRWRKSLCLSKRLKTMFYFAKIDRTIKPKPFFLKDNDTKYVKYYKRHIEKL
jgi:nucleoid DNA-binding protein